MDCDPNEFETAGEKLGAGEKEDGLVVSFFCIGVGGLSHPLLAACSAAFCASLSLPASMIPDRVPVKNVAIGIINSKNFWSIGLIAFKG